MPNKKINNIAIGVVVLLFIIFASVLLPIFNDQSQKELERYDAYVDCVRNEYGMHPSVWLNQFGELPKCNIESYDI